MALGFWVLDFGFWVEILIFGGWDSVWTGRNLRVCAEGGQGSVCGVEFTGFRAERELREFRAFRV